MANVFLAGCAARPCLRAQEITLQAPELVRRLVLVGTGPRGGRNVATFTPEAQQVRESIRHVSLMVLGIGLVYGLDSALH